MRCEIVNIFEHLMVKFQTLIKICFLYHIHDWELTVKKIQKYSSMQI